MRRCIVHFGLLKTGTTSIQKALFSGSSEADFSYISLGSPFIGRSVMTAFCNPPWRLAADLRASSPREAATIRKSLRESIAAASKDLLVLSSEALSRFNQNELADLIDFLTNENLSIEAVAYIRDYHSWCESLFQQSAQYGTWHGGLFPLGSNPYRSAVEKFDLLLGREKVTLHKYDRKRFLDGCVVRDFYLRTGLGRYRGDILRMNKGIGMEASKFLLAYHESELGTVNDKTTFAKNVLLAKRMRDMPDKPVSFHADLIARRARQVDAADLEWIEERLGESVRCGTSHTEDPDAIRSSVDLRRFSRSGLAWLAGQSGRPLDYLGSTEATAPQVAEAMAILREKVCAAVTIPEALTHSVVLPKIIWLFWGQGFTSAPPLVSACIESWRKKNPGWDIRLLDDATAEPYLRKANIPWRRIKELPREKQANILRMRLLAEEGGVWTDAATLCLQPLDDWLPQSMAAGLFVFRDPAYFLMVTNWFIASEKSGRLAELWRDAHEEFWAAKDYLHHSSYPGKPAPELPSLQRQLLMLFHRLFDRSTRSTDWWFHPLVEKVLRTYPYCVMHYIYAREYRRNPEWRRLADRMAYKDAKPCTDHYLKGGEQKTLSELIAMGSKKHAPILKLKWDRPPLLDT